MNQLGEKLGDVRRRRGYTQEQLAEASGLSVSTVTKLEQGTRPGARLATLHALARTLEVETSALIEPSAPGPEPDGENDARSLDLMPLRQALAPAPTSSPGQVPADVEQLRANLADAERLVQEGSYGQATALLPEVIIGSRASARRTEEASGLLSRALHLSGWMLTQLRAFDLAYYPLREAADTPDPLSAAQATVTLAWLLIRQGRLDEAQACATARAEAVEPRMSRATNEELSVWTFLLLRAGAAAARNNRPEDARETLKLAHAATAQLDPECLEGPTPPYGVASRRLVGLQTVENAVVAGNHSKALRLAERVPSRRGHVSLANHCRGSLDVAAAHAASRAYGAAFDVLWRVRHEAPEWIVHQRYARFTLDTILRHRSRPLSDEHRQLAATLGLDD